MPCAHIIDSRISPLPAPHGYRGLETAAFQQGDVDAVLRAMAVYRAIGTLIGGSAMVVIVPNLVDAPELTTLAIILGVALCVFVSLLDRTPRSYMFVLSGYTAALI